MLIFLSVLTELVYPLAWTALGIIGNAYIVGGQLKDLKDDLSGQMKEIKGDFNEVVTAVELREMSFAEKLLKGCGKK